VGWVHSVMFVMERSLAKVVNRSDANVVRVNGLMLFLLSK